MPEAPAASFDAASELARRRVTLAGVKRLARRVTSVAVCCFVGAGFLSGCSSDSDETPQTVAASTVAPAVVTTESSASPTAKPVSAEPADSGGTAENAGTADEAGTDTADQAAASQPDEAVAAGDEQATQDAADGSSEGQGDGGTTGGDDGAASGAESGAEIDLGGTDAAGADDAGSTEGTGDPDAVEQDPVGEGADEAVTDTEPTEDRPKVLALAVAQVDGTTLDVGAFAGRDVLVWFWAPW